MKRKRRKGQARRLNVLLSEAASKALERVVGTTGASRCEVVRRALLDADSRACGEGAAAVLAGVSATGLDPDDYMLPGIEAGGLES